MKTILRYEINQSINDIDLPLGYEVLTVGVAEDKNGREVISIWCGVDVMEGNYQPMNTEKARFLVFGTGADMDSLTNFDFKYIGTVQKANKYAFHVIQVLN